MEVQASAKSRVKNILLDRETKAAYDAGVADAIKTAQAAEEAIAGPMEGEGDVGEEELVQALVEAVESGEMSEEEAVQLVEELAAGGAPEAGSPEDALTPEMAGSALGGMVDDGDLTPKQAAAIIEKMYTTK